MDVWCSSKKLWHHYKILVCHAHSLHVLLSSDQGMMQLVITHEPSHQSSCVHYHFA